MKASDLEKIKEIITAAEDYKAGAALADVCRAIDRAMSFCCEDDPTYPGLRLAREIVMSRGICFVPQLLEQCERVTPSGAGE